MSPQLIREQAKMWLANCDSSAARAGLKEAEARLEKLDAEERRYVKAYGFGSMSEIIYQEQVRDLASRRQTLHNEIERLSAEVGQRPNLVLKNWLQES